MLKVVKYVYEVEPGVGAECSEKLIGREREAGIHVCFEDGSGAYVCKECFERRVNDGAWSTDSTETLLAS